MLKVHKLFRSAFIRPFADAFPSLESQSAPARDPIRIDIPGRKLDLLLPEEEVARRLADLPAWEPSVKGGYLRRYARAVTSACTGAVFQEE